MDRPKCSVGWFTNAGSNRTFRSSTNLSVSDGTFSRDDFAYDHKQDSYICPAGKQLRRHRRVYRVPRPLSDDDGMMRYRASKLDCQGCSLKPQCCPNTPARKI